MNYKLKHLSKYYCKPANELEFEAVKMATELGGVKWCSNNDNVDDYYNAFGLIENEIVTFSYEDYAFKPNQTIPVLDFINKLRMTEEEAEKLEDDRVEIIGFDGLRWCHKDKFTLISKNGHYFKTNEDGTEVTLHKR